MRDYDRLGAFDRCFLDLENSKAHMHIGAVMIFDGAGMRGTDGGIDIEHVRRFIHGRLARVPRYRQRLQHTPIENHPVWVDDYSFDLNYHIRQISVAKPGDTRQLKRLVAWLNSQPLDRSKPLWEMWVIEGLEKDRFAVFQKIHHCMVDGIAGAEEMAVVLSAGPEEGAEIPRRWRPRPTPTVSTMLRDSVLRRAYGPFELARAAVNALRRGPRTTFATVANTTEGLVSVVTRSLPPASETRLNRPIGAQRRFDWLEMDLEHVKAIKTALGGTLNDVVLTAVTGALRHYLEQHGASQEELAEMTLRAMCPVNRRSEEGRSRAGNKIAGMFVELPVGEVDARARLARVAAETTEAKLKHQADAVEAVAALSEWTTPRLLHAIGQTGSRNRTYNLVVTNIPGPQIPLYLLGARMHEAIPVVPIFEQQGLTIALFSYAGKICWGFNADREIVPDLHDFVRAVEMSMTELAATAGIEISRPRTTPVEEPVLAAVDMGAPEERETMAERVAVLRG
jgi:diacylglycerol O-acyltransferase